MCVCVYTMCMCVYSPQILRTHHINNTLAPCWETGVEVFVADVTQVSTHV